MFITIPIREIKTLILLISVVGFYCFSPLTEAKSSLTEFNTVYKPDESFTLKGIRGY